MSKSFFDHGKFPCLITDIENGPYHAGPGISKSILDLFAQYTPARAKWIWDHPEEKATSPAFTLGTAVHAIVLESSTFLERYIESPTFAGTGSVKAKADFLASCAEHGITPLAPEVWKKTHAMREAVRRSDDACALLESGFAEVSGYWIDKDTGALCRCRPDFLTDGEYENAAGIRARVVVDLKTAQHASMSEFAKASARFRYHVSDAFYSKGMAAIHDGLYFHYWFLVVETEPPHGVAIYELDQDSKRLGAVIAKHDLALIKQCMVNDDWPAYPKGARVISLPKWAEFTNII